jgi:hypothetical protein
VQGTTLSCAQQSEAIPPALIFDLILSPERLPPLQGFIVTESVHLSSGRLVANPDILIFGLCPDCW